MDTPYLFRFGFETPTQRKNNSDHGWDDEDSEAVRIVANSSDAALEWGYSIAREFVRTLFGEPDMDWSPSEFAAWVEPSSEHKESQELQCIPIVEYGQFPNIQAMVDKHYSR